MREGRKSPSQFDTPKKLFSCPYQISRKNQCRVNVIRYCIVGPTKVVCRDVTSRAGKWLSKPKQLKTLIKSLKFRFFIFRDILCTLNLISHILIVICEFC